MLASLAVWPSFELPVVQVWIHCGGRVQKPRIDETRNICRVLGRSSNDPRQTVVEDSIGHGTECTGVVDQPPVGVKDAITGVVRTRCPDCSPK